MFFELNIFSKILFERRIGMKTENGRSVILKAGHIIIFHEEGTVSFHGQRGERLHIGGAHTYDKFYLGEVVTKNKNLCHNIADLIAKSHELSGTVNIEGFKGHYSFKFA
jgi:hypothetical protein